MTLLPDIKELSRLLDLLRKKGVVSIETDSLKLTLGEAPGKRAYRKRENNNSDSIVTENLYSEEDALFWSSAGIPEIKTDSN